MGIAYVVHGACAGCSMGAMTTTLVGKSNSKTGQNIRMLEDETKSDSFDGNFGICAALTAKNNGVPTSCAMSNIPKWLNANKKLRSKGGKACVTTASFTVCTAGPGVIVVLKDGQTMADFSYCRFADGLPKEMQETFKGLSKNHAYGVDPIDMSTGNFIYSKTDLEIQGRYPITFKRFYNAMDGGARGTLGRSWTHNYNIFLTLENGAAKISFEDGHVEEYQRREDGSYITPPDRHSRLEETGGGYVLSLSSMDKYIFDAEGRIISISDPNGNITAFKHDGAFLSEISTDSGSLHIVYNKSGQITKLTDHTGRTVTYGYDGGFLISSIHPLGAVYGYEYSKNGSIENIINPEGVTLIHNEYDDKSRAIFQTFSDGGRAGVRYEDRQMSIVATEQNGNETVYFHDEEFRTTNIVYNDSEERFGYDDKSNKILSVDRNFNERCFAYDERGNLIKETDPLGQTTLTEYNELNKPIKITAANGGVTTYDYDRSGNLLKTADPLGREVEFIRDGQGRPESITLPDKSNTYAEYDRQGNITAITDHDGARIIYEYDSLNRVTKTTDGKGNATEYKYTQTNDIAEVTDPFGNTRKYEYNPLGAVSRITDFNGGQINYKYNSLGKVSEICDQTGGITVFTYDLMWNMTSITDPCGNTVKYVYDQYQRVIKTIDEEGNATHYAHDPKGNVIEVITPDGAKTQIQYDALDRRAQVIEPDGAKTIYSYDPCGNISEVSDAIGNSTKWEYDLAGQLIKVTDTLGNVTKFDYTPLGHIARIIDAKGGIRSYEYHPGGRLKKATLPSGESESYEYDKNGDVVKITDALGNAALIAYDSLGRITKTTDPLGHSKKYEYDAVGNITCVTDEKGASTHYSYSLLGDLTKLTDAEGHSTKYGYDKTGRLTALEQCRITDGIGLEKTLKEIQITTYEYNKRGDITAITPPLGNRAKYGYDAMGNVTSKLDEDGFLTLYEYNLVGKLSKISYADGRAVELGYDPLRRLSKMRDWLGVTNIETDQLGRAAKITDHEGREVGYTWNALGQRESLTYPDGSVAEYAYNPSGRLESVHTKDGDTAYAYNAMGQRTKRALPDGSLTKYTPDQLGRLLELKHLNASGEILDSFKYSYAPDGNITQIDKYRAGLEAESGVYEYSYDGAGRLVSALKGEAVHRYRYDSVGNRISEEVGNRKSVLTETLHTYNNRNQLIKTITGEATREYSYDFRGNLTAINENGQLKARYAFDAANMMTGAYAAGRGAAEYGYNGFKYRVKKLEQLAGTSLAGMPELKIADPTSEIKYILDMTLPYDNLLGTIDGYGGRQNFVWGNGLISAKGKDSFYYLQDHLGSPIRLMGENGETQELAYDEFGVATPDYLQNKGFDQPFGFTGYLSDYISGMYYAQARYYEPRIGRMAAKDPYWNAQNMIYGDSPSKEPMPNIKAITQSLNLYAYAMGNPVRYYDPSGFVISLAGTDAEKMQILAALSQLTNDQLRIDASGDLYLIQRQPRPGRRVYKNGTELIRYIYDHYNLVNIRVTGGGNTAAPTYPDRAINNVGTSADICYNPNADPLIMTTDPVTGNVAGARRPNYIGLGHELIHAQHFINGTCRTGNAEYRYQTGQRRWLFFWRRPIYSTRITQIEELATVGLGGHSGRYSITENMLRSEHGLNLRGAY